MLVYAPTEVRIIRIIYESESISHIHFKQYSPFPPSLSLFTYLPPSPSPYSPPPLSSLSLSLSLFLTLSLSLPGQPASSPSLVQPVLRKALRAIDTVARCVPGMIQALFLLAKIKFLSGNVHTSACLKRQCDDFGVWIL